MNFYFDPGVKERFPSLKVCIGSISDMHPTTENMGELIESVFTKVREKYSLEGLKDVNIFRAYRDFFLEDWCRSDKGSTCGRGVNPQSAQGQLNPEN